MIQRNAFCDICRQPITHNLTTIAIRSGPLTRTFGDELHLCPDDAERFASLLRGGPAELRNRLELDPTPQLTT